MADGKIKISELDEALQLNNDAEFPYSQENGGVQTTYKAPIGQIARKTAESITYTNLTTTAKTLVGAINELKSLGSPILLGTSAPTSQQGANGNLYVQYTEGTGGADDEVDAIFVKIDGAWCEISTGGGGGSGGHTIVDDSGTSLTQRTNLQFNGAYSEDNSTDDTTEVNVVRSMTKAEYNQLSAAEKVGFINITDETSQINATEIPMSASDSDTIADKIDGLNAATLPIESGSSTNTKDYIDSGLSGKADTTALPKVKYTEINVSFDNTGEGRLFTNSRKLIVGLVDLTTDSNYTGYCAFFDGNHTYIKGFSRTQQAFTSGAIANTTRKVGAYYLDNITIENV